MNISEIKIDDQRTKDWRIERLGKWTGSRISSLMVKGRSKDQPFGQTALDLIYDVISGRELSYETIANEEMWDKYLDLTTAHSKPMQFGTDNEEDAINEFDAWLHSQDTIEIPLVLTAPLSTNPVVTIKSSTFKTSDLAVYRGGSQNHHCIANFSASPDAVVYYVPTGEIVAVVETKVPLPKTFIKYRSEIYDADSLKASNADYYYQTHAEMMVTDTAVCFFACYQPFMMNKLHVVRIDINEETVAAIEDRITLAEELINKLS